MMTRPYDGQSELLWNLENLRDWDDLTAEDLGRMALLLERFIESELIDATEADRILGSRKFNLW